MGTIQPTLDDKTRAFAQRCGHIIPVRAKSKKAAIDAWQVPGAYPVGPLQNAAIVPSPGTLIIDVDTYHGSSLEGLAELIGADPYTYPLAETGGGGFHLYAQAPEGVAPFASKGVFPGIDVRLGPKGYCLLPGSLHESGNLYRWDLFADLDAPLRPLPSGCDFIAKLHARRSPAATSTTSPALVDMSADELAQLLATIPADHYGENAPEGAPGRDGWVSLLAACKEATGDGSGAYEAFLSWCLSDPDPKYHTERNARDVAAQWQQMRIERSGASNARRGTLIAAATRHNGGRNPIPESFLLREAAAELSALDDSDPTPAPVGAVDAPTADPKPTPAPPRALVDRLAVMSPETALSTLDALAREVITQAGTGAQGAALAALKHHFKGSFGGGPTTVTTAIRLARATLKQKIKDKEDQDDADKPNAMALDYGRTQSVGDVSTVMTFADQYYTFTGVHWRPHETRTEIEGRLQKYSYIAHPVIKSRAALVTAAELNFRREVVREDDPFLKEFDDLSAPTVINTQNVEIHISNIDGAFVTKEHAPASYQLGALAAEYETGAGCPRFEAVILDAFKHADDPREVLRHVFEIIGYAIQPYKPRPYWVLLQGEAGSGKSTLGNVIQTLCGPSRAVKKHMHEFDSSKFNFALSNLPGALAVIDDDYDNKMILPDEFIKSVSQNSLMRCERKHKASFDFTSTATPFIMSNEWPRYSDTSGGLKRRALVFEYPHAIEESEQDDALFDYLRKNELPGILNGALAGLQRLRARRNVFDVPAVCAAAKELWLTSGNGFAGWMGEHVDKDGDASELARDLWADYVEWCDNAGMHYKGRNKFYEALKHVGCDKRRERVHGLRLKEITAEGELRKSVMPAASADDSARVEELWTTNKGGADESGRDY